MTIFEMKINATTKPKKNIINWLSAVNLRDQEIIVSCELLVASNWFANFSQFSFSCFEFVSRLSKIVV